MRLTLLFVCCYTLFPESLFAMEAPPVVMNVEKVLERLSFGRRSNSDAKTQPCQQVNEHNATVTMALSKLTASVLQVDAEQQFFLAYCKNPSKPICALQASKKPSACVTRYNWVPARTQSPDESDEGFSADKILLPTACICWLGSVPDAPVIVED